MNELADVFVDLEDPRAVNTRLHSLHDILVIARNGPFLFLPVRGFAQKIDCGRIFCSACPKM